MSYRFFQALVSSLSSTNPSLPLSHWGPCGVPSQGDFSCAAAVREKRDDISSPQVKAQQWAERVATHPWVKQATAAPSGHLNIFLSAEGWQALLEAGHDTKTRLNEVSGPKTILEFVSANPTGPLHVGHARQAALGSALACMLRAKGHPVDTEFFYNDAGTQVTMLVDSVRLRWQELHGLGTLKFEKDGHTLATLKANETLFPKDGYHGTFIIDLAMSLPEPDDSRADLGLSDQEIKQHILPIIQAEQHASLERMGVTFDRFQSESSLHVSGDVSTVLKCWKTHGWSQDIHGKTWLTTTHWGDDKDRCAIKEDGSVTYFVPDVAYHRQKWQRGYQRALNIQGTDHHGTLMRVRAGLQALEEGIAADFPEVRFHTMVKVVKNGQPVKTSKRVGGYTTLDELLDALGPVALRILLLQKKPEAGLVLDLDCMLSPTADNPAYTIQYAHARLCGLLDRLDAPNEGEVEPMDGAHPAEKALLLANSTFEWRMKQALEQEEPHVVVHALVALSHAVHAAYQQGPKAHTMNPQGQRLRRVLFQNAKAALAYGAELLGVCLPDRMEPLVTPEKNARPKIG